MVSVVWTDFPHRKVERHCEAPAIITTALLIHSIRVELKMGPLACTSSLNLCLPRTGWHPSCEKSKYNRLCGRPSVAATGVDSLRWFWRKRVYPGGSVMTYRDNDRIRNPDDPWHREWGIGSIIASLVAIVIMAGILAYGATQATDMPTRSSTISQPITSG